MHLARSRHELEDDDIVIRKSPPEDHVLLTTIHQAKGREWPVVAVGLPRQFRQWPDHLERDLGRFRPQPDGEPAERVDEFDLRRQYYVAFSRCRKLLALTASGNPDPAFAPIWQDALRWPNVSLDRLRGDGNLIQNAPAGQGFSMVINHVGPLGVRVFPGGASITLGGRLDPDQRRSSG